MPQAKHQRRVYTNQHWNPYVFYYFLFYNQDSIGFRGLSVYHDNTTKVLFFLRELFLRKSKIQKYQRVYKFQSVHLR